MVLFWMHFTVYMCGGIVAFSWWNGMILTWKFIRIERRRRSAHHFGNTNGTSRCIAPFRTWCLTRARRRNRMAVSLSSSHFGLLYFCFKELDVPYMKMHQKGTTKAGDASARRSKRYGRAHASFRMIPINNITNTNTNTNKTTTSPHSLLLSSRSHHHHHYYYLLITMVPLPPRLYHPCCYYY